MCCHPFKTHVQITTSTLPCKFTTSTLLFNKGVPDMSYITTASYSSIVVFVIICGHASYFAHN